MTNARWTKDKPTKAGFYWFRYDNKSNGIVVEVFDFDGTLRFIEDVTFFPGNSVDEARDYAEWSNKSIKEPHE